MKLPLEFRWLKANGFKGFVPWCLLDQPGHEGLRKEYQLETGEDFYPIARRQDCDDVAGFEVVNGEILSKVINTHLTWSGKYELEGYPIREEYKDMFEWLMHDVIPNTWEWMSEEDLEDIDVRS